MQVLTLSILEMCKDMTNSILLSLLPVNCTAFVQTLVKRVL